MKFKLKNFIVYGFSEEEIKKMKNLINFVSRNIEYITIQNSDFEKTLGEVIENKEFKIDSQFDFDEKVVIFNNVLPMELDTYFKILKTKLSRKIIFAKVTENSVNMKIRELFDEFKMEKEYFKKNNK